MQGICDVTRCLWCFRLPTGCYSTFVPLPFFIDDSAILSILHLCLLRYFPSRNLVDRADNCYTSLYFLFLLFLPSMFLLLIISSGAPRQCRYESSGCVRKKITLYRNFFRNLNFKNIANFFKRTCCHLNHLFIFLYSIVMFSFVWIPLWVIKGLTVSQNDLLVTAPLFLISFIYFFLDCFSKLLHLFLIFL